MKSPPRHFSIAADDLINTGRYTSQALLEILRYLGFRRNTRAVRLKSEIRAGLSDDFSNINQGLYTFLSSWLYRKIPLKSLPMLLLSKRAFAFTYTDRRCKCLLTSSINGDFLNKPFKLLVTTAPYICKSRENAFFGYGGI